MESAANGVEKAKEQYPRAPMPESTHLPLVMRQAAWVALRHGALGMRLRAVGFGPGAALRAGCDPGRTQVVAMSLSGATAGVAGAMLILAVPFVLQEGFRRDTASTVSSSACLRAGRSSAYSQARHSSASCARAESPSRSASASGCTPPAARSSDSSAECWRR